MELREIQSAIAKLSPAELVDFRIWFADFQMDLWDDQIERDLSIGKLDNLIKEARDDYHAGKFTRIEPMAS